LIATQDWDKLIVKPVESVKLLGVKALARGNSKFIIDGFMATVAALFEAVIVNELETVDEFEAFLLQAKLDNVKPTANVEETNFFKVKFCVFIFLPLLKVLFKILGSTSARGGPSSDPVF
jgi:hypothetical protein